MKRSLALILAVLMIVSMFAGCAGKTASSAASSAAKSSAASASASASAGAASSSAAAGSTDDGTVYQWVLGTAYSDPATSTNMNAFGETTAKFCDLVKEYTNGRVIVTPYYDSVLGGSTDLYDQVTTNEIQVFHGQPMSTADPRYGITSLPGLFTSYDDVEKVFCNPDTPFYKLMQSVLNENGLTMVGNDISVFRVFYNSKKEVHVPSDLKGMTVRIYEDNICSAYWSGLCAASVIAFSELFTALQTGVVDGVEHTMAYGPSQGYQVLKYCSDINWQWTWGGGFFVNSDALAELPADLQEAVMKAGQDAAAFYNTTWRDYDAQCADKMVELGMTYTELTDDERAQWTAYGESIRPDLIKLIGEDFYNTATQAIDESRS